MALAVESSGSQTAVIGTEHTLAAPTTAKTRVLSVDIAGLANGDAVELRIKSKVRSTDTEHIAYVATYAHAQAEPLVFSIPVPSVNGASFTLKQSAGTARAFPWAVYTLD